MLNKKIRAINNTTEISSWKGDTCINQFLSILDQETFKECQAFICRDGETIHRCVRERQVAKFNRLWPKTSDGCSKEHSGSGKHNGYMYSNYSGHSNPSLTNITTSTATTTTANTPSMVTSSPTLIQPRPNG